ncbi:MAG: 23S rRNA (uracil(1939)-C(5))-methyltransferase RlmD [Calditrichaeota bacterium]|nr:MAG: 23S rRNA (uracil(1939)-C(5))-methyltransferase RlmD [Calditrichota bacterium]
MLKKGQEITTTIQSLAYGGQGVARVDDFVVFVRDALPGQKINALVTKKRSSYAEAKITEVIEQSPWAITPLCGHFYDCGGCRFQNLDYQQQLNSKSQQVKDLLERIGGLQHFEFYPTLPSADIYYYRNKMEFSFARKRWLTEADMKSGPIEVSDNPVFLGLHARGFFDKVVDIRECHLIPPPAIEILSSIRKIAESSALPVYSTFDHQGFWRFVIIRSCVFTPDLMVNVITSEFREEIAEKLKHELISAFPQITSLFNGITKSKSSVAFCEEEHLLSGNTTISERIGDFRFEISPNSFFQTNSRQVRQLYDHVVKLAEFDGDETVYDLYCGAGTIAIYISRLVRQVVGFEAVASAIRNANDNCHLNGIENCAFVLADLKDMLTNLNQVIETFPKPQIIILDPPRGGMHPKTVKAVLTLRPEKIIHVSCNPSTLARELAEFCAGGYVLKSVQPVDMFPHTAHVETVALLLRSD